MGIEVALWTDVGYPVGLSGDEKYKEFRKEPICEAMGDQGNEAPIIWGIEKGNEAVVLFSVCRMLLYTAGSGFVGIETADILDVGCKMRKDSCRTEQVR